MKIDSKLNFLEFPGAGGNGSTISDGSFFVLQRENFGTPGCCSHENGIRRVGDDESTNESSFGYDAKDKHDSNEDEREETDEVDENE